MIMGILTSIPEMTIWYLLGFVIFFLIMVLITRWIFRVNHIIDRLDTIIKWIDQKDRLDMIMKRMDQIDQLDRILKRINQKDRLK
jgi:hypothetical protein